MKPFRIKCLTACFIWFVIATKLYAGTASAVIDKTEGSVDDSFYVTLTITGKLKGDVVPPAIDGCDTAQAGVSHNMQWINGAFSSEDQYTFVIQPRRAGNFTVPSWKLKIDGDEIATLPLKFEVRGNPGTQPGSPQGSTQGSVQGNQNQAAEASAKGDEVYIEREIPARAPYVGEAFVVTVRVFHKIQVTAASPKRDSAPEFRVLSVPGDRTYQKIVNGVRYQVIEFKEAMIPLRAGEFTLPPYRLQATVRRPLQKMPGGSIFDFFSNQFFGGPRGLGNLFGREEIVEVASKSDIVKVLNLPDTNRPANFSGLVGQFAMTIQTPPATVAAGDSITASVEISGTGALDTLDTIENSLKSAGKVYPDKPVLKEEFATDGAGNTTLKSRKSFKWAVVPHDQDTDRVDLGRVTLTYFDPVKNAYGILSGDLGNVAITSQEAPPAARTSKSEVAASREASKGLPSGLITLMIAAAAAGIATLVWRHRRRSWSSSPAAESAQTASSARVAEKIEPRASMDLATGMEPLPSVHNRVDEHLAAVHREVDAGKFKDALGSLEHALREMIAAMVKRNVDALTPREIKKIHVELSENQNLRFRSATELLEQVEGLVFSQRAVTRDEVLQLAALAVKIQRD